MPINNLQHTVNCDPHGNVHAWPRANFIAFSERKHGHGFNIDLSHMKVRY